MNQEKEKDALSRNYLSLKRNIFLKEDLIKFKIKIKIIKKSLRIKIKWIFKFSITSHLFWKKVTWKYSLVSLSPIQYKAFDKVEITSS